MVGWFGAAKRSSARSWRRPASWPPPRTPAWRGRPGNRAALRQAVRSALRPLLWLGALAGAGTYLFAGTVIGLIYGSSGFGPAATILQVFAPGFLLLFIDILLGHIIYASGRGTGFAIAKIVSVMVGTALNFLLIPVFQARTATEGSASSWRSR